MPAPHESLPRAPGPASESLQGRNPRELGTDALLAMGILALGSERAYGLTAEVLAGQALASPLERG